MANKHNKFDPGGKCCGCEFFDSAPWDNWEIDLGTGEFSSLPGGPATLDPSSRMVLTELIPETDYFEVNARIEGPYVDSTGTVFQFTAGSVPLTLQILENSIVLTRPSCRPFLWEQGDSTVTGGVCDPQVRTTGRIVGAAITMRFAGLAPAGSGQKKWRLRIIVSLLTEDGYTGTGTQPDGCDYVTEVTVSDAHYRKITIDNMSADDAIQVLWVRASGQVGLATDLGAEPVVGQCRPSVGDVTDCGDDLLPPECPCDIATSPWQLRMEIPEFTGRTLSWYAAITAVPVETTYLGNTVLGWEDLRVTLSEFGPSSSWIVPHDPDFDWEDAADVAAFVAAHSRVVLWLARYDLEFDAVAATTLLSTGSNSKTNQCCYLENANTLLEVAFPWRWRRSYMTADASDLMPGTIVDEAWVEASGIYRVAAILRDGGSLPRLRKTIREISVGLGAFDAVLIAGPISHAAYIDLLSAHGPGPLFSPAWSPNFSVDMPRKWWEYSVSSTLAFQTCPMVVAVDDSSSSTASYFSLGESYSFAMWTLNDYGVTLTAEPL